MLRPSVSRALVARALLCGGTLSPSLTACGGGSDPASPVTAAATVTAVVVSPGTVSLVSSEATTLTAAVSTSTGSGATAFVPVWSSSAVSVATVGQDGVVCGTTPGTTTISAVAGGKTGTATVLVLSVASVAVSPTTSALVEGDTRDLQATATLSNATSAWRTATWSSSATTVATVSSVGQVTAVAAGTATITATAAGTSGTATVTVARRVATITLDISARSGNWRTGDHRTKACIQRQRGGHRQNRCMDQQRTRCGFGECGWCCHGADGGKHDDLSDG